MGHSPDLWVSSRGRDDQIYLKRWNGYSWSGWDSLGGSAVGGPALTYHYQSGQGWLYKVYHTGTDGAVYQKDYLVGSGWGNWTSLGGVETSSPAALGFVGPLGNHLYVLARGRDDFVNGAWNGGLIWHRRWNGSAWENWVDIGRPP